MSTEVRCHQHAEQMKVLEDIDYLDDSSESLMFVYMFLCVWGGVSVYGYSHMSVHMHMYACMYYGCELKGISMYRCTHLCVCLHVLGKCL